MALLSFHALVLGEHTVVVALDAHVGAHVLNDLILVCQCDSLTFNSCLPRMCCVEAGDSWALSLLILVLDSVVSEVQ